MWITSNDELNETIFTDLQLPVKPEVNNNFIILKWNTLYIIGIFNST